MPVTRSSRLGHSCNVPATFLPIAGNMAPRGLNPDRGAGGDVSRYGSTDEKGHPVELTAGSVWMIVSAALVLLMTPALGLFYGGMTRAKACAEHDDDELRLRRHRRRRVGPLGLLDEHRPRRARRVRQPVRQLRAEQPHRFTGPHQGRLQRHFRHPHRGPDQRRHRGPGQVHLLGRLRPRLDHRSSTARWPSWSGAAAS